VVLTNPKRTTAAIKTATGPATVPAWSFGVQGSAVRLVQASIDPAELLRTVPGLPNGSGDAETTVHVESDGRLTLQWSGAPSVAQAGGCGADYQTEFAEGSDVVVLRLVELPSTATETPKACNAVAYTNRYRFTAARPGQQDPRTGRVWLRRPACLAAQFRDNVFASAAAFSAPKTDAISGNERGSRPSTSVQVKAATVHRAVAPTLTAPAAASSRVRRFPRWAVTCAVPEDPPDEDSRTGTSYGRLESVPERRRSQGVNAPRARHCVPVLVRSSARHSVRPGD